MFLIRVFDVNDVLVDYRLSHSPEFSKDGFIVLSNPVFAPFQLDYLEVERDWSYSPSGRVIHSTTRFILSGPGYQEIVEFGAIK